MKMRQNHLALVAVVSLSLTVPVAANSIYQTSSDAKPLSLGWFELVGLELDCYFTIEELHDYDGGSDVFNTPAEKFTPKSTTELVIKLRKLLPNFVIEHDADNSAVVRIKHKTLVKLKDYVLDQKFRGSHSGTPTDFQDHLREKGKCLQAPTFYGIPGPPAHYRNYTTPLKVHKHDGSVRDALTNYLPLSRLRRVLWISHTPKQDTTPWTTFRFGTDRMPPPDSMSKRIPNKTTDFSRGEWVLFSYPMPKDLAPSATRFINKEFAKPEPPHQVRWAMLYLGQVQAETGIDILLKHLDYQYTKWNIVSEAYPAVRALTLMGEKGSKACIERLATDKSTLRRKLLCQVLLDSHGREKAKMLLHTAFRTTVDSKRREMFADAEQLLCTLAKE